MSLKKVVNEEIRKHQLNFLRQQQEDDFEWVSNLPISRQMSLKEAVNGEIKQYAFKLLRDKQEDELEWVGKLPISKQMSLKKAVNFEIKQSRLKFLQEQKEEVELIRNMPISRQMFLKKAVNLEIKKSVSERLNPRNEEEFGWIRNLPISRQMLLKKQLNQEIKKSAPEFLRLRDEKDLEWIRNLPISRQMRLKKELNQEIRQVRFKCIMQIELVTRFRTVDLKSKLCKEILNNARTKALTRERWPLRNKQHQNPTKRKQRLQSIPENECIVKDLVNPLKIEKFSREFRQRQEQRLLKNRMLQELRMVKLKTVIRREIDLTDVVARDYKAVVQDIQALGVKARAMQQMKNKCETTSKKETSQELEPSIEERQVMLKCLVNEAVKSRFLNKAVNKMLNLRSKVISQKSKLLFELKVHFTKTKCMCEIRQIGLARRNYMLVIMELKQRVKHARCVRNIKTGSYYLNHVSQPIEISSVVTIKQQMQLRRVNTVIKQAGLKVRLNQEIIHYEHGSGRALAIREIEKRFAATSINSEVRSKVMSRSARTDYNHVIQELEQRYRHREIVKEIKTRQKQIFWKSQTCIVIRQGGNKIRVNKEIRSIARQKRLKTHINTLIKQGGLKSRVQKEIRQLRKIALLKRQKVLKAKVNSTIREVAKARKAKRTVRTVIKQTSLKTKCNEEIRRGLDHPLRQVRTTQFQRWVASQEVDSNKTVPTWPDIMADDWETPISDESIAVMKLVESVTRVSETREKQDKVIRKLTQEITQQRMDFIALNKRVVDDKRNLYRELEELRLENEKLTQTLKNQADDEKLRKSFMENQKTYKNNQKHRQQQQTHMLHQETQEVASMKSSVKWSSLRSQEGPFKPRQVISQIPRLLY